MERKELLEQCSFISQVLRNEFVFGTDTLEGNVTATIEALAQENILQIDEGGFVGISAKEREIGRENYDSFRKSESGPRPSLSRYSWYDI